MSAESFNEEEFEFWVQLSRYNLRDIKTLCGSNLSMILSAYLRLIKEQNSLLLFSNLCLKSISKRV